ncbi:hypothetical protein BHE74_00009126 [Ensete ventricosum]|nr:hypothetical protein BHE74_00009126 [Ensete ventricosum]
MRHSHASWEKRGGASSLPELEGEVTPRLPAGERGDASSSSGRTSLVPEPKEEATPCFSAGKRGATSSPRGKRRRRLVFQWVNEALPRPYMERRGSTLVPAWEGKATPRF